MVCHLELGPVGRPAFVSTFHIRPTVVLDQTSCTVQYKDDLVVSSSSPILNKYTH
jgi:hypothetical protein